MLLLIKIAVQYLATIKSRKKYPIIQNNTIIGKEINIDFLLLLKEICCWVSRFVYAALVVVEG
jgi:hypothetical protein